MSTSTGDVRVKCIRLQWADQKAISTFNEEVTVGITENKRTQTSYLTIIANEQPRLSEELNKCQWLPNSAIDGIAAVMSSSAKIVIMYESKDAQQRDFIANLKDKLEKKQPTGLPATTAVKSPPQSIVRSASPYREPTQQPTGLPATTAVKSPPQSIVRSASPYREPTQQPTVLPAMTAAKNPPRSTVRPASPNREPTREREVTVDNLIDSIERGSAADAQYAAQYLAKSRADVQLTLLTRGSQKNAAAADRPIPADALKLNVEIESDLSQTPTRTVIGVRQGTSLRLLKEQIAEQMKIAADDQFWFAFDRYPIRDDYVFGSDQPVVASRTRPTSSNRPPPPTDPIRSGDTLVLYIARVTPL